MTYYRSSVALTLIRQGLEFKETVSVEFMEARINMTYPNLRLVDRG